MNISIENTSTLGRRLTVSLPNDLYQQQFEARFQKLRQTAQLKGFRPGKVPPKLLRERFGPSVQSEVIEKMVNESLSTVIQDNKLNIVGQASIEKVNIQALPEKGFEYIATFEIFPTIELADLSTVDFEKTVVEISDQDVQNMIEKLKDRFCDWENVTTRQSELTDRLTVDFTHQLEGESEPQTKKAVYILLGSEGILPGLSEALVGKSIHEEVSVNLTYPTEWNDERCAGKKVAITVLIHKIEAKKPLSQEALIEKLMIEAGDETKLKETIREKMETEVSDKLYDQLKEKVLEVLIEKNPLELPALLVQQELNALTQEIDRRMHQGVKPGEVTESELQDMAQKRVLLGLLVREYVVKKQLKANAELLGKEILKIARTYPHIDPQEVIKVYYSDKNLLEGVERMVLLDQAVNAMLSDMKVNEIKRSFEEVMNTA